MKEKLKFIIRYLPYMHKIIYFNFKYLPLKQAIRLPVFLYKPKLLKVKGEVRIETNSVKTAMVRLGHYGVSFYPNSGVVWENKGGTIVFKGSCSIGNESAISVNKKGVLTIGEGFSCTANLKLACYHKINIGVNVLISWENIIVDTDFHKLTRLDGEHHSSFNEVEIGDNCWIGFRCSILKGVVLPSFTIVAANSLLNKKYKTPKYSVLGGSPAKLVASGVYRDFKNDNIIYDY